MNPRNDKEERAQQAKIHTAKMTKFNMETNLSIANSKIYSPTTTIAVPNKETDHHISVWDTDSVSAAFQCRKDLGDLNDKTAILNFASYKNPGGRFIDGSFAQEEALCHASNLYNVLGAFGDFYEQNKKELNRGMYLNRAIYSPNVMFFDPTGSLKTPIPFDVLTCAAPNFSVAHRCGNFTKEENSVALRSRIQFILAILAENEINVAILGAFGCGVFAQDPYEVAAIFREELPHFPIRDAIFAIPGGKNLDAFLEVMR